MKRTKITNGNGRIETPARILGIDFTSAPRRRKPITLARGTFAEGQLRIDSIVCLTSLERFEEEIAAPGPWVAGIDFPFGQPRRLIRALGWPQRWNAYVSHVESMGKNEFESVLEEYSNGQPKGARQHKRATDRHARSISPMRLKFQPVGKMFFQGAPRILRSGASIVPCAMNESNRVIVEAYPALAAKALAGTKSYKSDDSSSQTQAHEDTRRRIMAAITGEQCKDKYDLVVNLDSIGSRTLVEDPGGDLLDAVLCAIQAAWSSMQPRYGVPEECDPLEGWIVDPSQLEGYPIAASQAATGQRRSAAQSSKSELLGRISTDPTICHGTPCIRGLRYPVDMILDLLSSGMTSDEILADYEDLEQEDILAVLAFAARLSQVKRLEALN